MDIKTIGISVDFDGVLHSYKTPFDKAEVIPDPPVPGAIEWLRDVVRASWDDDTPVFKVIIFSARLNTDFGFVREDVKSAICDWLFVHGFKEVDRLEFSIVKPDAELYIDDRGYQFNGFFPPVPYLMKFRPWNYRDQIDEFIEWARSVDQDDLCSTFDFALGWFGARGVPHGLACEIATRLNRGDDDGARTVLLGATGSL